MVEGGYKQTDIGAIPEDWKVKSLGDLFSLKHGFGFKSEFFSRTGPIVLTPGNFRLDGGLYFNERNTKRYSGSYPRSAIFKNGDLLIVMTDLTPDCNLLGKPAFIETNETILHNQRIGKVKLLTDGIDKKFLYLILLSSTYLNKIKEQATGSTVRHTSNNSIYNVLVPVPSLVEEQRDIVEALSDVDALIAALDKLIAKKRAIKTAAMQELLTGQNRLPGFGAGQGYKQTEVGVIPEDWEIIKLGDVTDKVGSGITPTGGSKVYKPSGRPFVRSQNVGWGSLRLDDLAYVDEETHQSFVASEIRKEDVLLNITGASIGRSTVADERVAEGNVNQHVCIIRSKQNELNARFLNLFLLSSNGQKQIDSFQAGGNREGLNFGQIRSFKIRKPGLIEEQNAIAQILSDMNTEITALETRRDKTQALKQGMMQELLTGRTRLI